MEKKFQDKRGGVEEIFPKEEKKVKKIQEKEEFVEACAGVEEGEEVVAPQGNKPLAHPFIFCRGGRGRWGNKRQRLIGHSEKDSPFVKKKKGTEKKANGRHKENGNGRHYGRGVANDGRIAPGFRSHAMHARRPLSVTIRTTDAGWRTRCSIARCSRQGDVLRLLF